VSIYTFGYGPDQWEAIFRSKPPIEIHTSDIRAYKECRQRWVWSSLLARRHGLEPVAPNRHLWLGRALHYALGAYYGGKGPKGLLEAYEAHVQRETDRLGTLGLTDEDWVDINASADLGRDMLEHYLVWAPQADKESRIRVTMPEVPLNTPVPGFPNVVFAGTADGHVHASPYRMPTGHYLLEWKSCQRYPDFNTLFIDEQVLGYLWAANNDPRFEGVEPIGVIFTFLRKKAPVRPALLKAGGLSKNKRADTTYEVYLRTLEQYGLDPSYYAGILNFLKEKGNQFFQRVIITRSRGALRAFERNLCAVVKEMLDPDTPIYPASNWFKCSWCAFRSPCGIVHNDLDPGPILQADYRKRAMRVLGDDDTDEVAPQ